MAEIQTEPDHPAAGSINEIITTTQRAAELTRKLMNVGRRTQPDVSVPLQLNGSALDLLPLISNTIGHEVTLTTNLCEESPSVLLEKTGFEQIMINLAINARDAFVGATNRPKLEIRTSVEQDDEGVSFAVVRVSDNGCGMSPKVARRAFEPFYSTKPHSRGTGLGLSTAYGVVTKHGGTIEIEQTGESGTTFCMRFPLLDEPAGQPASTVDEQPIGGTGSVLVVDDQAAVRRASSAALRSLGYTVIEAESGVMAKAIFRANPYIDLVFTDIRMPDINGTELARQIRAIRPNAPILMTSGYTQTTCEDEVLPKPFSINQLSRAVDRAINRSPVGVSVAPRRRKEPMRTTLPFSWPLSVAGASVTRIQGADCRVDSRLRL